MKANFKKNWWIYLIVGVLVCALAGGIIYACVAASSDGKVKTKKISASEFSLGGLDANGKYVETKESIYTKDAFECQGLTVTPEFESQVTYQIYFYDSTGEFLFKTESLEKAFTDEVDIMATYARIVITPNADENGETVTMNVFNKSKYAKQLTIKVNKEQKSFSEQMKSLNNVAVFCGKGLWNSKNSAFEASDTPFCFFAPIDVSKVNTVCVKLKTSSLTNNVSFNDAPFVACQYYSSDGVSMVALNTCEVIFEQDGFSYVRVDVSDLNQFIMFTDEDSCQIVEIYLM